nr:MAG TPA: hypothetical protein [Caudoviricetes sp.]
MFNLFNKLLILKEKFNFLVNSCLTNCLTKYWY